jgi:secreted trypsin-like serine protease
MKFIHGAFCLFLISSCHGAINSRIKSGYPIDIEQAPYIVHVQYLTSTPGIYEMCGGSILNSRYIMTAGHCVTTGTGENLRKVPARNFTVHTGSTDKFFYGEDFTVSDVYIRDEYNGDISFYDIGILKLDRDLILDGNFRKATILPTSSSYYDPVGTNCYVQGWGYNPDDQGTTHLYRADVSVSNINECARDSTVPISKEHQVCALGNNDADACAVSSTTHLLKC